MASSDTPSDDENTSPDEEDFSLFQREENVLRESETVLSKLGTVGEEFKTLADNYRQSYREQQRLIKMSDKLQLQLHDANEKLEQQAEELNALNESLKREIAERTKLSVELERLANVDSLTEALTRRHFIELVERELSRHNRKNDPMSLLLVDFDHFKEINDTMGHHTGDHALKLFGSECRRHLRDSDIFGRLGGEEFAIVLPESDMAAAKDVAERLRAAIEVAAEQDDELGRVTISIGITMFRDNDRIERALRRADAALYKAKAEGRNKVISDDA